MKNFKNLLPFIALILCFTSCINDDQELTVKYYKDYELMEGVLDIQQANPMDYTLEFPSYYGRTGRFDDNMATLGRVMFYDKKLSADGTISCASCHKQEIAFSDDKAVSDGISNQVTDRNSLALGAVFNFHEYYGPNRVPFFWDNSIQTVEEQIVTTFASKKEMDMTIKQVVDVMNSNDYYKPLMFAATGEDKINETSAVAALAVFVNSMGSYNSKFDQALSKESVNAGFGQINEIATINFKDFNESENRGKTMYLNACASCHGEVMGAPNVLAANNGLSISPDDPGVNGSTKFKVPSLRNLTLTGPYMHDGRFETIDDVLDHYSSGMAMSNELHEFLRDDSTNDPINFEFSTEERTDLIAFLKTFDDESFLVDPKYADPFIK